MKFLSVISLFGSVFSATGPLPDMTVYPKFSTTVVPANTDIDGSFPKQVWS